MYALWCSQHSLIYLPKHQREKLFDVEYVIHFGAVLTEKKAISEHTLFLNRFKCIKHAKYKYDNENRLYKCTWQTSIWRCSEAQLIKIIISGIKIVDSSIGRLFCLYVWKLNISWAIIHDKRKIKIIGRCLKRSLCLVSTR